MTLAMYIRRTPYDRGIAPTGSAPLDLLTNFDCQMSYYTEKDRVVRKRFPHGQSRTALNRHRDHSLTLREREVLHWIARGKSNAEIGAILEISAATVSKHLEHIYPKLGVENRTAAASFVPRQNL